MGYIPNSLRSNFFETSAQYNPTKISEIKV
jgi:hypothetical protein